MGLNSHSITTGSFWPQRNRINRFTRYSVLILKQGYGSFQVDFRNYHFQSGRAIFLSPGQYFQLISGNYEIDLYEFAGDKVSQNLNSRYLFKHLVSLGYIDLTQPKQFHLNEIRQLGTSDGHPELLTLAINEWILQNPFRTTESDINLLFDIKEIVDDQYREPISMESIASSLREKPYRVGKLTREKLHTTVKKLAMQKLLLEAKRKVAFTDWSTKEIAYDLGFSDPPYFNRFFKNSTRQTPHEFREIFDATERNTLLSDLNELIDEYYKRHHSLSFYADRLNMTPKSLSRKLKEQFNISVHQLIQEKIIQSGKMMLTDDNPVKVISSELGFREPNHFTAFFKTQTGLTPTEYKQMEKICTS